MFGESLAKILTFEDSAGSPSVAGQLQRNGTALEFYNGSAAKKLASSGAAALSANRFVYSDANGDLVSAGAATDGQLLIGSSGNAPALAAISAGTGISVTNGSGTITITNTSPGSATKWNAITNPDGNQALTMAAYTSTWTWNDATGGNNLLTLTDTASNSGTGFVLSVETAASSAASPFQVKAQGTATFWITNAGAPTSPGAGSNSERYGSGATSAGASCVVWGNGAASAYAACVVLGRGAASAAANQFVAGSESYPTNTVFFGKGASSATPTAYTLSGTAGSGTDIAGGGLAAAGGISTGAGTPGTFTVKTCDIGSTGTDPNTLYDRLKVISAGSDGKDTTLTHQTANGAALNIKTKSTLVTVLDAAYTDVSNFLPANSWIISVEYRVNVQPTGATTFDIGTTGIPYLFGDDISAVATTVSSSFKKAAPLAPYMNSAAATVRITPDTAPSAADGRIRVTAHYVDITEPTS